MIRSRMASAIVGSPTMSYQLGDGYCEVMIVDFLSCQSSIISSRMGRSLAGAGKRMCQNEPNPESQIKDFRGFSSLRELGNAANGIFYSSQCWESRFSLISCFPNVGKAVFRWFLVFPMLGKPIFIDFWFSPVAESRFLPIFVHRTPTKASFSHFSLVVPLRKLLFAVFRPSYPYESLLFPFFINCTPYLSDFSRKSMIYARIWVVFLIEQFRIVDFQKGICVLTRPLLLSVLPASAFFFIIPLNWFPRVKLGWECVTSKHSESSCIMLRLSAAKFLEKQAGKKSIYRLIKQKTDDRKDRLDEIRMLLSAFRCTFLLWLSY